MEDRENTETPKPKDAPLSSDFVSDKFVSFLPKMNKYSNTDLTKPVEADYLKKTLEASCFYEQTNLPETEQDLPTLENLNKKGKFHKFKSRLSKIPSNFLESEIIDGSSRLNPNKSGKTDSNYSKILESRLSRKKMSFVDYMVKAEEMESIEDISTDVTGSDRNFMVLQLLKKVVKKNHMHFNMNSAYQSLLEKIEHGNILPRSLDRILIKSDRKSMSMAGLKLGDDYVSILSETIGLINVNSLKLSDNNLTKKGCEAVIRNLKPCVDKLDLSNNNVGEALTILTEKIKKKEVNLKKLYLRNSKVKISQVIELIEALARSYNFLVLDLTDNDLDDSVCDTLSEFLSNSSINIVELYLGHNQITNKGAFLLFNALKSNKTLNVFDLSSNRIGSECGFNAKNKAIGPELCDFIRTNSTVIHLDLSRLRFSQAECADIAQALESNHTICGLHFEGNYGEIDADCHLIVKKDVRKHILDTYTKKEIESIKASTYMRSYKKIIESRHLSFCWLCDQWSPLNIELKRDQFDAFPVFVHFEHFRWEPIYVNFDQSDVVQLEICTPIENVTYFLTEGFQLSEKSLSLFCEPVELGQTLRYNYKQGTVDISLEVKKCFEVVSYNCLKFMVPDDRYPNFLERQDNTYDYKDESLRPRMPRVKYQKIKTADEKKVWRYKTSMFKDYAFETEEMLRRCFEFDIQTNRVKGLMKSEDEQKEVLDYLWANYRMIKETYKNFACTSVSSSMWGISSNGITELLNNMDFIDGKSFILSASDLEFEKVNYSEKKYKYDTKGILVRHKFMEYLVRICQSKYLNSKTAGSWIDAVKMGFENHFTPKFSLYDSNRFRTEKYWNCHTHTLYYTNARVMEEIQAKYKGKKTVPGKKKFTCLEEFKNLCTEIGLFHEKFLEKDAVFCFYMSLVTTPDEIKAEKMFEMYYEEFLEGVARVSEFTWRMLSEIDEYKGYAEKIAKAENVRVALVYKIELLVLRMYDQLFNKNLKRSIGFVPYDSEKCEYYDE